MCIVIWSRYNQNIFVGGGCRPQPQAYDSNSLLKVLGSLRGQLFMFTTIINQIFFPHEYVINEDDMATCCAYSSASCHIFIITFDLDTISDHVALTNPFVSLADTVPDHEA